MNSISTFDITKYFLLDLMNEMLRSHAINPMMLRRDDFEGFFTTRTKALMEIISKAMAKCLTVESFGTPGEDYNNGKGNGLQHQY